MRVLFRLLVGLLALLLLAALVVATWLGYATLKRSQRERMTIESLAPPGGRWVDVGDSRLFVQEWGPPDGPVLLLAHGTGAWSGTWFELPAALAAAGWRVVAVDLPPFGFSAANGRPGELDYSRPAQALRLLHLIGLLGGPSEVTLVGHSFGAGPALEAAMRSPSRLRRLVLVAPALRLGPAGEAPSLHAAPRLGDVAARPSRRALGPDLRHRELPGIHRRPARPLRPPQGGDHARAGCRLPAADASVLLRRRHRRLGVRVRRRGLRTLGQPRSAPDHGLVAQRPARWP